ncbi:MAG: proline--tRNA ligase [Ardenticatenaceae bacterium]|nr:proline--tRNA ligase [Ardenticatenaceae bacterium]MCB8991202.1 proline--tRNA ligase [Ardenticatenaceae bacterium]MCB9004171.1 proline--tRNA ligase [Ardenticatenaceae bacterium]
MADKDKLVSRSEDFNEWYNSVVLRADMADYGPVRGTMIVKPYGWTLWENIQQALDQRFKATGVQNAGFPMFIPMSFLQKEAKHVEGFAPELAVVTHGGGQELGEPIVVRPTSETIIGHTYANWIQSYRDLPLLLNLWNSVVRWELRTKLFLRTLEFYWQEGHTAHATAVEAAERTRMMLDVYADFAINEAAVPVIRGEKSELERFAGANQTLTIEAMMGDGKALQSGTSHNLGQNFAKAFDIQYLDPNNELQYAWTTSWGLSTRFVGAIIMTHGDDNGLILPPRLAPYQVVIVPIYRKDAEKTAVLTAAQRIQQELTDAGIRVKMDDRDNLTPGYKFNDWELRGVPARIEIGPRDIEKNSVALARRDVPGRDGKQFVSQDGLAATVQALLVDIQASLLTRATQFRDENTHDVTNYDEFKTAVQTGFARVWWDGSNQEELKVKEETKATIRCFPLEQPEGSGTCFYTGRPANKIAIFGRAY